MLFLSDTTTGARGAMDGLDLHAKIFLSSATFSMLKTGVDCTERVEV